MAISDLSREAVLLALQAPTGTPRSSLLATTTDPTLPPKRAADVMDHFFDGLYDKSPESHLSRFCKVLLGEAGAGQLRKRYILSHFQSVVLTTHFADLDRLYGALFGFKRLLGESLNGSPYYDTATPEEWEAIEARDSSYRNRVEQFSRSLMLGPTKTGMEAVAAALLGGVPCTVYETYMLVDENGGNPGGSPPPVGARTYGEVEATFPYYENLDMNTYADIEGGSGTFGRTTTQNRQEFVVRPHRIISAEETYELMRVLTRLKPAEALLTIDPQGVVVHTPVVLRDVAADSTHWEVNTKVAPKAEVLSAYWSGAQTGVAQSRPRPAFTGYQGEAWAYNSDVVRVTSYTEEPVHDTHTSIYNFQRVQYADGKTVDYTPDKALTDTSRLLLGRIVSDGVLTSAPAPTAVSTGARL